MGIHDAIRNHPSFTSAVGGAVIGAGAVAIAGLRKRRKKKKVVRRSRKRNKTGVRRKRKVGRTTTRSRRTTRNTKAKRRARAFRTASSKRIFTTKNGQPYIKLKSGKCRFISKKSARLRRKRKGGFR